MKSKKILFVYLILLLAAVYLTVFLYNLSRESKPIFPRDFDEIKVRGELNVVTDYNSIGYRVSGDSVAGFQYELVKALERHWDLKTNLFLENSLDESLKGLAAGKYDVVARNIPVNSQLRERFNFTRFINLNKQVLVQRKSKFNGDTEPIRQHLDLAKKTVYVPSDSPVMLRLRNLSHEIGDTIYIEQHPLYEAEQLVMMVSAGDIEFTVCDEEIARRLAARFPEIDIETDIGFTQLESWCVRKDSPVLLDSLNVWLENFRRTSEFQLLIGKYY